MHGRSFDTVGYHASHEEFATSTMLIIGIPGKTLSDMDRDWLLQPQVVGVILFSRNFDSRDQVTALVAAIRDLRGERFVICVDQEGGPVARLACRAAPSACPLARTERLGMLAGYCAERDVRLGAGA